MQKVIKIAALPNNQQFVTYSDNTSKEITAEELSQILEENDNNIKRWSMVGNIQIIQFNNK
jgi:succinate dehydrogenase flavin-adding protein (antitoxin of CptAB toxin-antitoxin module)